VLSFWHQLDLLPHSLMSKLPLNRYAWAGLLLPLLGSGISCGPPEVDGAQESAAPAESNESGNADESEANQSSSAKRVRVETILVDTIERSLEAVANIESLDVVDVLPERSEPIVRVLVEEGDRVSKGQVLAECRNRVAKLACEEARVRVTEATNEVTRTERDYLRNRQLADRPDGPSLLSKRDLENSEQAQLTARTALQSAQVGLDQALLDLERCSLIAPIDGTVTLRDISTGDQTVIGQRAFQVADLDHPRVIFYRPQSEFGLLEVGQKLSATSEAFLGRTIHGSIERIAPIVDSESGTIKVTARLETEGQDPLPNGLLVRLRLVLESRVGAILVPKQALNFEGDTVYIFLVDNDVAKRFELETGLENPTHIQVMNAGFDAEQQVVVVGQDSLADGDKVEILAE
jgi:membrane fusion protein, multidrug efflux system